MDLWVSIVSTRWLFRDDCLDYVFFILILLTTGLFCVWFGNAIFTMVSNAIAAFEYKVCDPSHLCDTGTVEVVVGPVIDLIFAMDDIANVTAGDTIKVDVTANDVIRVNATLNITEVRGGRFGTCAITSDNQIEYTADEDRVGADRCDYVVCLEEFCDKGRLEVEVIAPLVTLSNAAPLAKPDTVTINVNELALIDPLRNDEDEDGDDLTLTEVSSPSNGDVEIVGGGTSLEYMPDDEFTGVDGEFMASFPN